MSDELVTIDIQDGVADVRLNRVDKYNALSPAMFKAIIDAGEQLAEAKEVRAVVLSGNGRGFCAGLDMDSFANMADNSEQSSDDVNTGTSPIIGTRRSARKIMRNARPMYGSVCQYP